MRLAFARGWILPHVALATLLIATVLVLPRFWRRFRVEAADGRGLVAIAFGMPAIVFMLRWAIQTEVTLASMRMTTPAQVYFKWCVQGVVLLSVFLVAVVYLLRLIKVGDGFSFGVLWAIMLSGCLAALLLTTVPQPAESTGVVAPAD